MYENGLVSIVTPAYRAAAYVSETIKSVLAQTYVDWEMIIVDDCSPDNTCEVVESWVSQDARIKLIRQPVNGGPAVARATALKAARGRWIAFLDSDDLWAPAKLETQIRFQSENAVKLTFTSFHRINADGSVAGRVIDVPSRLDYHALLGNTAIATSTVLIDRHLSGDFTMRNMYYDDFGCWLDILRSGGLALGIHSDLMAYRVLSGSVSRNKWRSAKEVWKTYRQEEKLSLFSSAFHFFRYAKNGILKYRKF